MGKRAGAVATAWTLIVTGLVAGVMGSGSAAVALPPGPGSRLVPAPAKAGTDVARTRIVTDGFITSTRRQGDEILVNGRFQRIGRFSGSAVALGADGARVSDFPTLDGMVSVSVPDGADGWFVGGDFSGVGGVPRAALAHLEADGTLVTDVPTVRGRVYALSLVGTTLYVGGDFDRIGGVLRDSLAAVDVTTGAVTSFAPGTNGYVSELLHAPADGSRSERLVVTTNPGYDRTALVAVETGTGERAPGFTPGTLRGTGGELALDGDRLYVGAGGVVALDAETGVLDPTFAAGGQQIPTNGDEPADQVHTLLVDGDRLLVGGTMTSVGGARGALLALDTATGANDPTFDARISQLGDEYGDRGVLDVALDGDDLWVAGRFHRVAGRTAANLTVLEAGTGTARDLDLPHYDDQVNAVDVSAGQVLTGGYFSMVDSIAALGLAHLDAATLEPLSGSRFRVPHRFQAMLPLGETIYLADTNDPGPDGPRFGNEPFAPSRGSVVAVDATTGKRLPDLGLDQVSGLASVVAARGRLYAVRRTDDRKFPQSEIAVFSGATGRLQRIIEVPLLGYVTELRLHRDGFLLAGSFKRRRSNGQQANLALLRLSGRGTVTRFDVNLDGPITDLTDAPSPLYVTGFFDRYLFGTRHQGIAQVPSLRNGGVSGGFRGRGRVGRIIVLGDRLLTTSPGRLLDARTGRRLADPSGLVDGATDAEMMPGGRVALLSEQYYDNLGGRGFVRLQFLQPID